MKIGIIDADLIGRPLKSAGFPNLACMKIAGYHKDNGDDVDLITSWDTDRNVYDKVYVSKVFSYSQHPDDILSESNVIIGGTGFFFDKSPKLPDEIEHHMPDYHLYDDWIEMRVGARRTERERERESKPFDEAAERRRYNEYTDYSIGFVTRGCIRRCPWCVNQNYTSVQVHSPLNEFYDSTRKKICLLDDNAWASTEITSIVDQLKQIDKPVKWKQGIDIRVMTESKFNLLFNSGLKYDGFCTFAFDNINDKTIIENKIKLMRQTNSKNNVTMYILSGYPEMNIDTLYDTMYRIQKCFEHGIYPYIQNYKEPNYKRKRNTTVIEKTFSDIARWINQPHCMKTKSFREFVRIKGNSKSVAENFDELELLYPEFTKMYADVKWYDYNIHKTEIKT